MTPVVESDRPWLVRRAELSPDRPALVREHGVTTWRELNEHSDRIAGGLVRAGIGLGDRIAAPAVAHEPFVALLHAAQRVGAVFVPLPAHVPSAELISLLDRVAPKLVVDTSDGDPHPAAHEIGSVGLASLETESRGEAQLRNVLDERSAHSILFTSGTAARPKAVVLSHANHHASAVAACRRLTVCESDRWLAAMPLNHVGGLSILLRAAIQGFSVVLQRGFDADDFDRSIRVQRVTLASLVSPMLARWLDLLDGREAATSFRCALLGGAAVARPLLERAGAAGIAVATTYGLSEAASQVTTGLPGEAVARPGSSGRALDITSIRIANADDRGVGEINVSGPQIMIGYLDDDSATAGSLRNGWLYTGDLGRIDDDGFLYVVGRADEMIVSGGENISPAEVETALCAHPAVADCAVYGIPDGHWGQRVACALVWRDSRRASDEDLRAFCRESLAAFKVPKQFRSVAALPRTSSGKLRRSALASLADQSQPGK